MCNRVAFISKCLRLGRYKTYHAIAAYRDDLSFPLITKLKMEKGQPFYTMQVVEGEPNSETEIQLLQHDQQWGKYELKPHTGKQHQLRVHLSHLGFRSRMILLSSGFP